MRWVWIGALFGVAWLAQASQAQACSCPAICAPLVLPAGGEVPANLPGFLHIGIYAPEAARLVSDDGQEIALIREELPEGLHDAPLFGPYGGKIYRLAEPMTEGRTYRWSYEQPDAECRGGLGIDQPIVITATAPQPFPTAAGVLSKTSEPSPKTALLSSGSSCEADFDLTAATYALSPDPSWTPWSSARYEISRVNGTPWRPRSSWCTTPLSHGLAGALREEVFAVCAPSNDVGFDVRWEDLDYPHPTFFTQGERTVEMGLWLPGMEAVLWSQPTTLSLTCDDATSDTNSNTPTTDDANEDAATTDAADGCQKAHGRGGSAWGILGVLALALRGWHRPRR